MGSVRGKPAKTGLQGNGPIPSSPPQGGPTMQCQTCTCYVFGTFGGREHREMRACLLRFGRFLSDGVGTGDRRGGRITGVKSVTVRQIARPRLVRLVQVPKGVCYEDGDSRSSEGGCHTHLRLAVSALENAILVWKGGSARSRPPSANHQSQGNGANAESKHSAMSWM
jgi:hypothetical protein